MAHILKLRTEAGGTTGGSVTGSDVLHPDHGCKDTQGWRVHGYKDTQGNRKLMSGTHKTQSTIGRSNSVQTCWRPFELLLVHRGPDRSTQHSMHSKEPDRPAPQEAQSAFNAGFKHTRFLAHALWSNNLDQDRKKQLYIRVDYA
jgi:hypothetical protein